MRFAVGHSFGKLGARVLEDHGHVIAIVQQHGEERYLFLQRAFDQEVDAVILPGEALKADCRDRGVAFFRHKSTETGVVAAHRILDKLKWIRGR